MRPLIQDRTVRHVAVVVAIKLCVLTVLWWAFIRDARIEPDPGQVASAVLHAAALSEPDAREGTP
jgi:hypothetical protein